MNKFLAILLISLIFCGCNTVSVDHLDKNDNIAVLPTLNFSGYDITQFPGTVYRDAELAKLFKKLEVRSLDFSKILENKLYQRLSNSDANFLTIKNQNLKPQNSYDLESIKQIQRETPFDKAFFCVVTQLSMKNLFTEREFYIGLELVCIDNSGSVTQKASKSFVIHLPDSVFTPLGIDFSSVINQICENLIEDLT